MILRELPRAEGVRHEEVWRINIAACAFALLTAERVAAAPVIWDFIATSCSEVPNAEWFASPVVCFIRYAVLRLNLGA